MKSAWLGLGVGFLAFACGGDDSTIANPDSDSGGNNPDTSSNNGDSGNNPDTSANPDTSTPVDSGNFDPSTVPGLVLWLDAAKNITNSSGTSISKWGDRTTHKNDAAQGNGGRQPTSVTSGINGLPTVHFNKGAANANGQMVLIPNNADHSLEWGTGDFYVAVVARYDNDPADGNTRGTGVFFTKFSGGSSGTNSGVFLCGNIPGVSTASTGLIFLTSYASGDSALTTTKYWDSTPHMFTAQRVARVLTLAVDGVTVGSAGTSSGNDVSNPAQFVRIGADGDANIFRLDGDISEEMAVKGTLAASDQAGIEGYLKSKYAL